MSRILFLMAALCFGVPCFHAPAAWAHAFLEHASPPVGSEGPAPQALSLTFTEPVEPLFSSVQVTDAGGSVVSQGKPSTGKDGRTLTVTLKPLPPGAYKVEWHVTSVDTHKTEGHFSFSVRR